MAVIVQQVVGQFELIEGDDLLHPLRPFGRGVRVVVHPAGRGGVGLAGHQPGGAVEGVPGGGGRGGVSRSSEPRAPPRLPPAAPGLPSRTLRGREAVSDGVCGGQRRAGRGDARPPAWDGAAAAPGEGWTAAL